MCDEATLDELRADDRIVVRYVDNPNGSLDDIAGICNEGRNVVGLMPHPERASDAMLGSADGVVLLQSLLAAAGAAPRCDRIRPHDVLVRRLRHRPRTAGDRRRHVRSPDPRAARGSSADAAALRRRHGLRARAHRRRCCSFASRTLRSPASTRRAAMVEEARARVPERVVHRRRRDRTAAPAGRRRVRPAAARPPARSGCRARALGRGDPPAGVDRVRGAGAISQRRSAVHPVRSRGHRGRRRARRHALGRTRARRDPPGCARMLDRVVRTPGASRAAPPRCSGATRSRGATRLPTPCS